MFQSIPIPAQNIADYCMNRFDPWLTYPAMECSVTGKMFTYADIRNMAKQFGSFLLDSGLTFVLKIEFSKYFTYRIGARR